MTQRTESQTAVWDSVRLGVLLVWASLYLFKPIHLVTADLGRHLKNGEVLVTTSKPVMTNLYSYTYPARPVVNHHWASGALFFLVNRIWGFEGLSVFYGLLCLGAVFLLFRAVEEREGFQAAWTALALAIPLIASRAEVRPEGFSYFLMALEIFILSRARSARGSVPILAAAVFALQVLWVNLHIYFFLGVMLATAFWSERHGRFWVVPLGAAAACFVNPFGWRGALEPLFIFRGYGYLLAENQSLFFWLKRLWSEPARLAFYVYAGGLFLFVSTATAWFWIGRRNRGGRPCLVWFAAALLLGLLAMKTTRAIPLFGMAAVPALARVFEDGPAPCCRFLRRLGMVVACFLMVFGLFFRNHSLSALASPPGLGLEKGVLASADFFRTNHIQGPVFNNYDIGGYLIYNFYPQSKVFVDNRPEAYPASFFKEVYVPAQEDEGAWKAVETRYSFNAVFFYRHDMTPWGQPFLIRRLADPEWAPVFVDDFALILVKRNTQNRDLIAMHELPKSIFRVRD